MEKILKSPIINH